MTFPSMYSETGITIGDKDSYQNLHGLWIYLFDELDSLKRSDLTRTKTFLTSPKDHYRESYGRRSKDFYRQNVFCGTTNDEQYLVDPTGNRRFWPARTKGQIDVDAIRRMRDQLWAEAVVRYKRGEKWHVDTAELRALCEAEQVARTQVDPWTQAVAEWVAHPTAKSVDAQGRVHVENLDEVIECGPTTAEALQHAIGKRLSDITRADEMRMGSIFATLGLERVRTRSDDGRVYRYQRALPASPSPNEGRDRVAGKNGCKTSLALPALPESRTHMGAGAQERGYSRNSILGEAGGDSSTENPDDFTADLEELGIK